MFENNSFSRIIAVIALSFAAFFPLLSEAQEHETLNAPIVAPSDSGAYHAINQLPESIRSSAPFARDFYEFALHAGNSGVVDHEEYLRTLESAKQTIALQRAGKSGMAPQATEGTWMNIGLTGADSIPSAGVTTAIVFDPQHPNVMYAGGSGGGVWKSFDTGATWTNLTDNYLPNLSVASIAVDPVNTNTIYVGTGYCYFSDPNYGGSGLWQSMDGGSSFQRLTIPGNPTSFVKVVVDPANHNIVLASSSPVDQSTVYRSTNAGASWTALTVASNGFSGGAWDIIATPTSGGTPTFYLLSGGGIYKSTNDGSNWAKVSTSKNFPNSIDRGQLASPNRSPNQVFALITTSTSTMGQGSTDTLLESDDAGSTWTQDNTLPSDLFMVTSVHYQGWYDLYLAVSPNSVPGHDTIYAGGVIAYVNNGSGWNKFSDYNHADGGGGYPHVDHHSFAINPTNSNIVYDGNDGGLWINYAGGSNDPSVGGGWKLHSLNMVTTRFYHFGFNNNKLTETWAGAQDQGLWRITAGQPPKYFGILGDAMQPIVNPQNAGQIFAEGPNGEVLTYTIATSRLAFLADTGVLPKANPIGQFWTDSYGWDNPLRISPIQNGSIGAAKILYLGLAHLYQSTDQGSHWSQLSPSFGQVGGGYEYCTAIGLPNWNATMLYAAGNNSFKLSTDFGTTWLTRTNPAGFATSINCYHTTPGFVVASIANSSKKVMYSMDSGKTWSDASGTAPNVIPGAEQNTSCNVMSLAIDSTNPLTTWYAATDFGMYQTTDQGKDWTFMGPALMACRDVQIAPDKTTMRVASYGRGMWELQLPLTASVESDVLTATKSTSGTELSWNVQNEPSGAEFQVERSIDGNAFESLQTIAGSQSNTFQTFTFTDQTIDAGTYLYRIHEVDQNGTVSYSNQVELHYGSNGLYVYQAYPDPYMIGGDAASIALNFEIPQRDNVRLQIFSIDGRIVRTLINHTFDGGPQQVLWDAKDDAGNPVAPGTYFYTIQTSQSGSASGKMVIVRE